MSQLEDFCILITLHIECRLACDIDAPTPTEFDYTTTPHLNGANGTDHQQALNVQIA